MSGMHKFSLKTLFIATTTLALFCAVTWPAGASHTMQTEIYSTLTSDTIKPKQKNKLTTKVRDTARKNNSSPFIQTDTTVSTLVNSVDTTRKLFSKTFILSAFLFLVYK